MCVPEGLYMGCFCARVHLLSTQSAPHVTPTKCTMNVSSFFSKLFIEKIYIYI